METCVLHIRYRIVFVPFLLILLVLKHGDKVMAQQMELTYQITQDKVFGPVVEIDCSSEILQGSADQVVRWVFRGQTLVENDELKNSDSRYRLARHGQKLLIKDLVKEDEGKYLCQVVNRTDGTISMSRSIDVEIRTYLPSKDSLQCGIHPALIVTNGNNVSFSCTVGKSSNADAMRELFLKRKDGSLEPIVFNTTRRVAPQDEGAMLVCQLTSTTFPSARYECIVGPITFDPPIAAPTMPSSLRTIRPVKFLPRTKPPGPNKDYTGAYLAAVFGSIYLCVFFIIIFKGIVSNEGAASRKVSTTSAMNANSPAVFDA